MIEYLTNVIIVFTLTGIVIVVAIGLIKLLDPILDKLLTWGYTLDRSTREVFVVGFMILAFALGVGAIITWG